MTRSSDRLDTARLREAPRLRRAGLERPRRTGTARGRRTATTVVATQVLVLLALTLLAELGPAPVDETVPWQWLGDLLTLAIFGAVTAAAVLRDSPRWSLAASGVAATAGIALSVGCPLTGHHDLTTWWYGELALFGVMAAAPVVAWRRLSRS